MARIVLLTEGKSNPTDGKTAAGILRYRTSEVVAVLDSTCAGRTAQEVLGAGGSIPVVASLDGLDADTLLIGIAPAGGKLPEAWRAIVRDAISRGLHIVNGLHLFLGDDAELRELAARHGVKIHDVRRPPPGISVSTNSARKTRCFRVHTVGHDCSVGKMLVSLEIAAGLTKRGRRAKFIATGQTGIMISGDGLPIDAIVSDFTAGAIESLVLAAKDEDFVVVEGQGSLIHPLYSGVTLGLLHGCAPQVMVMCIEPSRRTIRGHPDCPMPPVETLIDIYERMARFMTPSRVVAVAVNTSTLSEAEAEEACQRTQEVTGLPVSDVIRYGPGPIVDAVLEAEADWRRQAR